jgi:hypothetical protein
VGSPLKLGVKDLVRLISSVKTGGIEDPVQGAPGSLGRTRGIRGPEEGSQ